MSSEQLAMRKVMIKIFLLSLIALTGTTVSAQTISLEQVRALALANSRSLQKLNLSIDSAGLDERSRIFSNLPSLSAGASASLRLWNAENASPAESSSDRFSAGVNLSLSQTIFAGGKTLVQKAINAISSESAGKDALAEYFNVLDSADNAYYAVLEAAETLEAEESSLQTAITGLSIAEIRQAHGIVNRGDYLKALAEKEARENSRNQARRNLALCITKLKALTGLADIPRLEGIDFSGYEELIRRLGTISDEDADSLYAEFWNLLAEANPALAKADLSRQRAEKNLSMEKLGYFPGISASVSTGYNITPNSGLRAGNLSLTATIPLNFWVTANNIEKSKIARDQTALDYLSTESQLETDLQSVLLTAFANAGSVLSSARSLEYAERHFEFVMERYRLSQSSVSDLGDASSLLITSRNNLTKARYGFLQSLSKLRSLGAIDDEEKLLRIFLST
jgi:outer membrane protein